jgi:hypothetical protein
MLKELLRVRTTERPWLLQQIRDALEDDQRVRAAWLEGSLARGTPDALSDLDVAVVVSDAAMSTVAGGPSRPVDYRKVLDSPRGRWVSDLAEPLLLLEAPQNAPLGGAFLTSFFAGEPDHNKSIGRGCPGRRLVAQPSPSSCSIATVILVRHHGTRSGTPSRCPNRLPSKSLPMPSPGSGRR